MVRKNLMGLCRRKMWRKHGNWDVKFMEEDLCLKNIRLPKFNPSFDIYCSWSQVPSLQSPFHWRRVPRDILRIKRMSIYKILSIGKKKSSTYMLAIIIIMIIRVYFCANFSPRSRFLLITSRCKTEL